MNYEQALKYVIDSYKTGHKRGRNIFLAVLHALGDPQDKVRAIHMAGTNGKGSCCAMIASVIKEAGFVTGFFSSPHLHSFNERFRINGEAISNPEFAQQVEKVKTASLSVFGKACESLSYFELLTAMMFNWFCERRVDYAVIETGMGGRLDSTNVIPEPLLSIIGSVSLDHTEYLGQTIELIAAEKAGIIKKNCPVLLYPQSESVYNIIKAAAAENCSELICDSDVKLNIDANDVYGAVFSVKSKNLDYDNVRLRLPGEFQIPNSLLALNAVECFMAREGLMLPKELILRGLLNTSWAGRFEIIGQNPLFLVDGAHNPGAVESLVKTVGKYFAGKRITLIVGILKDKSYKEMMASLSQIAYRIVITKPYYDMRAASLIELSDSIPDKSKMIISEEDCAQAVETAYKISGRDDVLICCGSLYLVGDIRKYVLETRKSLDVQAKNK